MSGTRIGVAALGLPILAARLPAQQPPVPPTWNVNVGAVAFAFPRYPGSDEYHVLPVPMVQVTYRGRVFVGSSTVGVGVAVGIHAIQTPRFRLTTEFAVGDARPVSRGDALAGLDDRAVALAAAGGIAYRFGPVEGGVGIARGLNDHGGTIGSVRASFTFRLGRLFLTPGVSTTLADATEMRREFGITPAEAVRRQALIDAGDPRLKPGDARVYRPEGGIRTGGASLFVLYPLTSRWSLIGSAGFERLSDRAAASPIVEQRNQYVGLIGVSLQF